MTLNTKVRVLGPVDPFELFKHFVGLMGHELVGYQTGTNYRFPARWESATLDDGSLLIETVVGQGLPAWFILHGRVDDEGRPLAYREVEELEVDETDPNGYTTGHPACWVAFSFDTTYSYRDEQGMGCGELHASLLLRLAPWLAERGADWEWVNEFTGEQYNKTNGVETLVTGGQAAEAWFRDMVMPAILIETSRPRAIEGGSS